MSYFIWLILSSGIALAGFVLGRLSERVRSEQALLSEKADHAVNIAHAKYLGFRKGIEAAKRSAESRRRKLITVCAWCEPTPDHGAVSHGICESCRAKMEVSPEAFQRN